MANNINTAVISGNVTRDPELRHTKNGTAVVNIGVAVNKSRKQEDGSYEDSVSFFDLTVWGNYGELVARKVRKGDAITASGELEQQRWEAEDGTKRSKVVLVARQIDGAAMYRSKDEENESAPVESAPAPTSEAPAEAATPTTDDIPF